MNSLFLVKNTIRGLPVELVFFMFVPSRLISLITNASGIDCECTMSTTL